MKRKAGGHNLRVQDVALLAGQAPISGPDTTSSPAETGKRGALNPNMSRWLMGLPLSWTLCGMLAYLKMKSRRRSAPSRSSNTASGE
jgi:hypothetical protein